jgi:hypothetical protein
MISPPRFGKPDLVLGALAGVLLLLPLPALLTVGTADLARLGLFVLLVVPPVVFMTISHRRLGRHGMRSEAVRIRR